MLGSRPLKKGLLTAVAFVAALLTSTVHADDYAREWGPKVGSKIPLLQAPDQTGAERDLSSLAGENGLLIFINRSADW